MRRRRRHGARQTRHDGVVVEAGALTSPLKVLVSVVSSMPAYFSVMAPAAVTAPATFRMPSMLDEVIGPRSMPPRSVRTLLMGTLLAETTAQSVRRRAASIILCAGGSEAGG